MLMILRIATFKRADCRSGPSCLSAYEQSLEDLCSIDSKSFADLSLRKDYAWDISKDVIPKALIEVLVFS